ncbi:hypothetical protein H1R20_g218, partial [Candolleomyces eurysporus]
MPPPARSSKLKEELVKRATEGSTWDIHKLSEYIMANKDYDVAVLGPLMYLLDPGLIPSAQEMKALKFQRSRPTLPAVHAAMHVLSVMVSLFGGLESQGKDAIAVATRLVANHLPNICQWTNFFAREGLYVGPCGSLFLLFVLLDELQGAIMSSTSCIESLLAMWTSIGADRRPVVVSACTLCPLVSLLKLTITDDDGRTNLCDIFGNSREELKSFISALVQRMDAVSSLHAEGTVSTSFTTAYVSQLLDITQELLTEQNYWIAIFRDGSYLSTLSSTLLSVSLKARGHSTIWKDITLSLRYMVTFCSASGLGNISPVHQMHHALKGGILRLLSRCLTHIPPSCSDFSFVARFYGDILAYTVYRRVTEVIFPFHPALKTQTIRSLVSPSPEITRLWPAVDSTVQSACAIYDHPMSQRAAERICDNIHVSGVCSSYFEAELTPIDSIVLGAGALIQSLEFSRSGALSATLLGASFYPFLRFQLLAFIEHFCETQTPVFEDIRRRRKISESLQSLVIFVDHVSLPPTVDLRTFDQTKSLFERDMQHLTKRSLSYLAQSSEVGNLYLVQFLFPYGITTLRVFARMCRDVSGGFYSLSSIFTVIESPKNTLDFQGKTAREVRADLTAVTGGK